jgi:hypothetical protein
MRQRWSTGIEKERQAAVDPAKLRRRKHGRRRQPLQPCIDQAEDEPQLRIERTPGGLELGEECLRVGLADGPVDGGDSSIDRRRNRPLRQGGRIRDGRQRGGTGADGLDQFAT